MVFVSCFTIEPNSDRVEEYLDDFEQEVLAGEGSELWITGYQVQHMKDHENPKIRIFESTADLIKEL
ncbi:MAG: hypothetical protein CM15mP32_1250 [Flavobacteriaceae bacterium]|nr:MAG: hypothetical protein CM15mP32_1250 [Flavobacteriaceae bacterium]